MKKNIHIATVLACCLMAVSTQVRAQDVITASSVVTSSQSGGGAGGGSIEYNGAVANLIAPSREVGFQWKAASWNTSGQPNDLPWGFYPNPDSGFVMVDLGQNYDLDTIRLWNASHYHTGDENWQYHCKDISIHVAADGTANLPTHDMAMTAATDTDGNLNYFQGAGWSKIWDADLAQGKQPTLTVSNELLDPELVLDASASTGVRYIGIDFDSRWGTASSVTQLGHIQVTEAPPTPGTLIYGK